MGRKTFESLPKILPERKHIILTNNKDYKVNNENVEVVYSIAELQPYIDAEEEYFVIGGGQIYRELLPYAKRMYITRIYDDFNGDTYFPQWDENQWEVVEEVEGVLDEKNKFKHKVITYIKKTAN